MATYKIDSSLLTAQADEIRTLNGTTATMNPSQMTTALQSANAEVAEQEQKIIEITEMLQGKAMGGGSGTSVETCTVTIECNPEIQIVAFTTVDESGAIKWATTNSNGTYTCVCNSVVCIVHTNEPMTQTVTNCELIYSRTASLRLFVLVGLQAGAGENATYSFVI